MADDEERVTMPFKFVTGASTSTLLLVMYLLMMAIPRSRFRRSLSQPKSDQTLLAELRRLPQVHPRQRRGFQALPSGMPAS